MRKAGARRGEGKARDLGGQVNGCDWALALACFSHLPFPRHADRRSLPSDPRRMFDELAHSLIDEDGELRKTKYATMVAVALSPEDGGKDYRARTFISLGGSASADRDGSLTPFAIRAPLYSAPDGARVPRLLQDGVLREGGARDSSCACASPYPTRRAPC